MTALLSFLKLAWPYLIALGIGAYGAHELDQIPYNRQVTALASYKAQVADADEQAQKAAADALQAQVNARLTTEANNGKVISELTQERDNALHDRDANLALAHRLLSDQARSAGAGRSVPQAAGGSITPAASGAKQNESLAGLLVDTADECERNADRLDALIAEIKPQL